MVTSIRILVFLAWLTLPVMGFAQHFKFDIWMLNKKIGDASISRILEAGGQERYKLLSQAEAKVMFIQQSSKVNFDVLFKGGQMLRSYYNIQKDDESIQTTVEKSSQQYKVSSTLGNRVFSDNVSICSIHMYFKEPVGISKVFIERLGNFLPLVKVSPGIYEYVLPDGIRNIYRYKNGVLYELEMKKGMGSVYMRPAK